MYLPPHYAHAKEIIGRAKDGDRMAAAEVFSFIADFSKEAAQYVIPVHGDTEAHKHIAQNFCEVAAVCGEQLLGITVAIANRAIAEP